MAGFSRPPRAQLLSHAGQVKRSSRTPRERREVWVRLIFGGSWGAASTQDAHTTPRLPRRG